MVQLLKSNADLQLRRVLQLHNFRTVDQLQELCSEYEDLWTKQGTWRRRQQFVNEIDGGMACREMPGRQLTEFGNHQSLQQHQQPHLRLQK